MLELEALWSAEFQTNNGYAGAGVVVFESGRIYGGDASYYYLGSFQVKDGVVTADIDVVHYSGPLNNVFGPLKHVDLTVSGQLDSQVFTVSGTAAQAPGLTIVIRLTKRAVLP